MLLLKMSRCNESRCESEPSIKYTSHRDLILNAESLSPEVIDLQNGEDEEGMIVRPHSLKASIAFQYRQNKVQNNTNT